MFIELKNVNKVISGRQLLSQVNCKIEAGQIAVFEGINGSGKTLILKTILGLMKVDGEVLVAGKAGQAARCLSGQGWDSD